MTRPSAVGMPSDWPMAASGHGTRRLFGAMV